MSQQEMAERAHSPISGSKIERFLCCPTSFHKDERDLPDTSPKNAAKEGERAHDLAEQCLLTGEDAVADCRNSLMRSGAIAYRNFIRANASEDDSRITTEQFVCMGANFGLPPQYIGGYYDAMYDGDETLHLFDYKFGFHVVEPNTRQLTFYILAKLMTDMWNKDHSLPFGIREICEACADEASRRTFKQSIIQPKRKDGIAHTYELSLIELKQFAIDLWDSVGRYVDSPRFLEKDTKPNAYCKYCEKRLFCPNVDRGVLDLDPNVAPKFHFERKPS